MQRAGPSLFPGVWRLRPLVSFHGAQDVIFLDGGKIVEEASPKDFFDHPQTERAQRFLRTFTFDAVK